MAGKKEKMQKLEITAEKIWLQYEKGRRFNNQFGLDEIVETNENFFIGKQWEGVEANGLPTPVFNFLKRVVLFTVASITSDNVKMQASALNVATDKEAAKRSVEIINNEFAELFERNKLGAVLREYMRNAAVDGDGCTYSYWDEEVPNGNGKGGIVTEIVENNRVFFGNPNERRVQKQPYILISFRRMCKEVRKLVEEAGGDVNAVNPDADERNLPSALQTDDKVTVVLKLWRNDETNTIWCVESTKDCIVREPYDTELTRYPITWLNWDYIQDSYHGQAMITGLIPNQIFINKLFAMSMISLMTTAYPKIVYDRTRIKKWDNRVGAAIGIAGGDVNSVAKIIDPAQISPQIAQFIELAVDYTQTFLGATSAAMGDTRPDNTSAIIALQRAASVPNEITKQNLYQSLEDLGLIYIDFMQSRYGTRKVMMDIPEEMAQIAMFAGMEQAEQIPVDYNFSDLRDMTFAIKLDVGASAYWSEIASMQTLDNLLMQGKIDVIDYLERVPDGYITGRGELVTKLKKLSGTMGAMQSALEPNGAPDGEVTASAGTPEIPAGRGYSQLQRSINETGVVQ